MTAPFATVIRNGVHERISASHLVPGDIVILEAGIIISDDIRVIESSRLKIEEAALTVRICPG